jgi:hypothetical protein
VFLCNTYRNTADVSVTNFVVRKYHPNGKLHIYNILTRFHGNSLAIVVFSDWQETDPTSRHRGRPIQTREQNSDRINIWSQVPQWARRQDILTDWPTVSRNVTSASGECVSVAGGYKYGNLALQVGVVSDETVKYGYGFCAPANCRPILSSERVPHRNKTANLRQQHTDRK